MSIIELHGSKLCSVVHRTINCLTNDNLINIVNPKIDRMIPLVPRVESLIKQVRNLLSQLTAKFGKLPKDFQHSDMTKYSQQLKRTAEAAIVTASTIIESQSTIVGGKDRQQPPSSSSGEPSEDLRKRNVEEWISHLTVSHGEMEQEYDDVSELMPDDSVSSIGLNTKKRSQQINEAGMPGSSLRAEKSAGTSASVSTRIKDPIPNVFEEAFTQSSDIDKISSSSEEESSGDTISENTLTEYRADRKVATSYDEKSAKELLAVLGANLEATEWKVNDVLLDLAKVKIGQGVKSSSNIVGTLLYLLEMGADVNAMNADSLTPLHYASHQGNTAVVKVLIEQNADLNIKDKDGWTALHLAVLKGHTQVVEVLLKGDVDVEQKTERYRSSALALAAQDGQTSTVNGLLKAGASFNVSDINGYTPLHTASGRGHVGVVETLLKAGASIGGRNNEGLTPLHCASWRGHVGVVETLLKAGASFDLRTESGYTALIRSAYWGHKRITELLLAAGADIRATSKTFGGTVLNEVLYQHHEDCDKHLCAFCAGSETRQDMVKLLCEKGADTSAKNDDGDSPLKLVCKKGVYSESEQKALIKVLRKFGAK